MKDCELISIFVTAMKCQCTITSLYRIDHSMLILSAFTRLASGWCMLRKSLHEPIVSLQMESEQHNGCKIALQSLLAGRSYPVHGSHSSEGFQCLEDELDLSPLLQFLADEVSP
jgi:hypothetical protein